MSCIAQPPTTTQQLNGSCSILSPGTASAHAPVHTARDYAVRCRNSRTPKSLIAISSTRASLNSENQHTGTDGLSYSVYRKQTLYEKTILLSSGLLQLEAKPETEIAEAAYLEECAAIGRSLPPPPVINIERSRRGRPKKDGLPMVYSSKRQQSSTRRRLRQRATTSHSTAESVAAVAAVAGVELGAVEQAVQGVLCDRKATHRQAGTSTTNRVALQVPPQHALARRQKSSEGSASALVLLVRASKSHKLLTREEEHKLMLAVQQGNRIRDSEEQLQASLGRPPTVLELLSGCGISSEDELRQCKERAVAAKNHLVRCNVRLVLKVAAAHYRKHNVSMEDLALVGLQGLQKGMDKFDMKRGFKLSTYCYWWILAAVTNAFAELDRCCRLPKATLEQLYKLYGATKEFHSANEGRSPTQEQLMDMTGFSTLTLARLQKLKRRRELSVEGTLVSWGAGDNSSDAGNQEAPKLVELLVDQSAPDPSEVASRACIRDVLHEAVHKLPRAESHVVSMLYGLNGCMPMTRKQVSEALQISSYRVGQLHNRALEQLKQLSCLDIAELSALTPRQILEATTGQTARPRGRPRLDKQKQHSSNAKRLRMLSVQQKQLTLGVA